MRDCFTRPITLLAIDPGMSGAVARMGRGKIEVLRDFETIADIAEAVTVLRPGCDCAVIELVGARPGQGVCSMFSFGKSTGAAMGALYSSGLSAIREVTPQKWQNFMREKFNLDHEHHPEFDSRALALRLFPEYAGLLKRKKDHNTADAILLGLWWLMQPVD